MEIHSVLVLSKLLLASSSTAILGSVTHGTHGHIFSASQL
jgi:hypothetical protein